MGVEKLKLEFEGCRVYTSYGAINGIYFGQQRPGDKQYLENMAKKSDFHINYDMEKK